MIMVVKMVMVVVVVVVGNGGIVVDKNARKELYLAVRTRQKHERRKERR